MKGRARLYLLAAIAACLPLLAIAVAGCGGGGGTTTVTVTDEAPTGESTTTETTSGGEITSSGEGPPETETTGGEEANGGSSEAPAKFVHLTSFQSPSGNIGCILFEGDARCDIDKHTWTPPPRPASCSEQVDYGQGLTVGQSGNAGVVCAGDTAMNAGDPVLEYGTASEVDGTLCVSRATGITCTNGDGHGFTIAIQSYRIF